MVFETLRQDNLERLLRPKSVAVVGASANPSRIGGRPIRYLLEAGFRGPIYPVNPTRDSIQGLQSYPSVSDIGAAVDAVVIAVPAAAAVEAVRAASSSKAGGCILFSADFAESGEKGLARQEEITRIAQSTGVRLVGPNCLGLFNAPSGAFLTFSSLFDRGISLYGSAALISQSGGFGSHLLEVVKERGTKVGTWITTGNEADVEVGECIEWAARQESIDTILAYSEGVKCGDSLRRGLIAAHQAGKPVIFMKSGRSKRGIAAASTHTAALAGSDAMYQGIFDQFGVRRVYSAEEMADLAYMMQGRSLPGNRSAVLFTVSGAGGVQMSDSAADAGLDIPILPQTAQDRIKTLASFAASANPVDFTAQALNDPAILPGCLQAVAKNTDIGSFVIYLTMTADDPVQREPLLQLLGEFAAANPDRFFVICMLGSVDLTRRYEDAGFRVFSDSARAINALALALRPCELRKPPPPSDTLDHALLSAAADTESQGKMLLKQLGLQVPAGIVCNSPEEAAAATSGWRWPVVCKIISDRIVHKTDAGGVRLGLTSCDAVRSACQDIVASARLAMPDLENEQLLVEEQINAEAELILGIENDATLGPMVMIGLGGVQAEIYNDVVFRMAPVDEAEADVMLRSLRGAKLLNSFRGRGALDVAAVARSVSLLSRFAAANKEYVQSVDVNPLLVAEQDTASSRGAVAADCVIVLKQDRQGDK